MSDQMNHPIIVIGASMGGIEALQRIIEKLPADLPAAIFVVQHVGRGSLGYLPQILERVSRLPVVHPHEGQAIEPGWIYVAPPDFHMLVGRGVIHISSAPVEHFQRPSIDALFRSAANAYGADVIGVVLTGYLADGTAGLCAIKACGGVAIVQEPSEAPAPSMPLSALANVIVDHRCKVAEIGPLLVELVTRSRSRDSPCSSTGGSPDSTSRRASSPREPR